MNLETVVQPEGSTSFGNQMMPLFTGLGGPGASPAVLTEERSTDFMSGSKKYSRNAVSKFVVELNDSPLRTAMRRRLGTTSNT